MFRISACTAMMSELALNVMTSGVDPSVPPVNVPMVVPA
jgi:hypothetical protein